MIRNLPEQWDQESDLIAVGSGIGGLAAAIAAHDHGASAMVLERADKVGGVTATSMGELWVPGNRQAAAAGIEDSPESGFRYLQRLAMGYGSDVASLNQTLHGAAALAYFEDRIGLKPVLIRDCPDYYYGISNDAVAEGRMLEVAPFAAADLGEWQARTRVSPFMPYGMTHEDIFVRGGTANIKNWDFGVMGERLAKDERCLGPGLAAYFVKGVLDRGIGIEMDMDVRELIADGERVVGVRAVRDGQDVFIKAGRGVVLAVSSYERRADYTKRLSTQLDIESMLPPTIDGAHFRLAGALGARIARVPDVTGLGFTVPGDELETGEALWRPSISPMGLPHGLVVNRQGRRFANEAFYRALMYMVDFIDGATQTHPNFPCWIVIDSQAREKYPFGSVMPGGDLPEGMGEKGRTVEELAGKIGIDAQGLKATLESFNKHAAEGKDPAFGRGTHVWSAWMCGDKANRPNPNLGTVQKPPFYAVPLHRMGSSGVPPAGLLADHHCRVLGWDDRPIAGLYVAGNSMARLESGAVMQSGISNARGMTHGYLAGRHAAGHPSGLLEPALARLNLSRAAA